MCVDKAHGYSHSSIMLKGYKQCLREAIMGLKIGHLAEMNSNGDGCLLFLTLYTIYVL